RSLDQAPDQPEMLGVVASCSAFLQVEIGKDNPHMRARLDGCDVPGKMNLQTRRAVLIQAFRQSIEMLGLIVYRDDSWRRQHHFAPLKIIAMTAPSNPLGISISPGCGKASCPPFSSIAKLA